MLPSRFFDTQSSKRQKISTTTTTPEEEENRLSTKTRLAQFRHSQSTPSKIPSPVSSSEHAKNFQKKIASKLSKPIKWEQLQSIWEPGVEQKKKDGVDSSTITESQIEEEEEEEEEGEELAPKKKKENKKPTQLELQWAEFKKQYPNLVIFMEVGYKIRLFGADAILGSKVLSIAHLAIPGRETCFFPKTNLYLHLSRMVMAGHKVGLFLQSETKSLRNQESNRKNINKRVFDRHLAGVYSISTWTEIDPNHANNNLTIINNKTTENNNNNTQTELLQNWIVSFYSTHDLKLKKKEGHELSMVAVCPQNGEIIWDNWRDDSIRSMLETRLTYLKPTEIIIPLNGLDHHSEKLINWIIKESSSSVKPRLESTEQNYTPHTAYELVSRFCQPNTKKSTKKFNRTHSQNHLSNIEQEEEEGFNEPEFLHHIVELSDGVLIALAGLIIHMKNYQLESIFRQPTQFKSFSNQNYMILDSNTLKNLEVFENSTDRTEIGSLFWTIDRAKTWMGKRLLKKWIGRPLIDMKMLKERGDAIEELIVHQNHPILIKMRRFLNMRLPDLEKTLVRIQYGKCTEKELLKFLDVIVELTVTFGSPSLLVGGTTSSSENKKKLFKSDLLNEIFTGFSLVRDQAIEYRSELNPKAISKGEYNDMFTNADEQYPELTDLKDCISCIEAELIEHLQACRITLDNPKLEYITIGSEEMLIEVRLQHFDRVPENWIKFSSTRAVQRYRTSEAQRLLEEREKYKGLLSKTISENFQSFLKSMEEDYNEFREVINRLSQIDCLLSLSKIAIDNKYVKPELIDDSDQAQIEIVNGRHPIVEQILDDPFVPNHCSFNNSNQIITMVLTGNNMGGKSVTAKMIGCIVILAQMGSYVPAEKVRIGLFDGCYTRMGMSEELGQGRSAFMVEMNEAAKILRSATPRSLVIIDELGYGTSTYDGLAIAAAVLDHLVSRIQCITVFITHYPQLNELAIKYPNSVKSYHMKFLETHDSSNEEEGQISRITFLYKLVPGLATKSHGIHVARLAGLPSSILHNARLKSSELEESVGQKKQAHQMTLIKDLLSGLSSPSSSSTGSSFRDTPHTDPNKVEGDLISRAQSVLSSLSWSTESQSEV
ncbi:hypothetical protein PSTG_17388 [Puccinia striiformis f. sp. tritici PST-78]|uniref:DNA mismatch repair protein n=1 Tax=Puccinia striiformis f. sp. tritici PST-78 TaxID=1165861 RepID=A0A0L0UPZ5_9BASI|nr:hypothetical protein PSTG_17388 [Puccinia striiformis f. sp. tritici PST-78]